MDWDKRYLDLLHNDYEFPRRPVPLAAIYVLGQRRADPRAPYVEPLHPKAGLITMIANGYATALLNHSMRAWEFKVLADVAMTVPVRQVTAHADTGKLSKLCDVILNDFETSSASANRTPATL